MACLPDILNLIHKTLNFLHFFIAGIKWTRVNWYSTLVINVSGKLNTPELNKETARPFIDKCTFLVLCQGKKLILHYASPGETLSKLLVKQHVKIQMILKCRLHLNFTNHAVNQSIHKLSCS